MSQQKRMVSVFAAAASFLVGATFLCGRTQVAVSAEETVVGKEEIAESSEDISTRGLFTSLSLSIDGGNGRVWATVKNDVTLFPATVMVVVELYCSDTYQENYEDMKIVSRADSLDLNMGETIVADGYTNGEDKYWQGRMRYKIDADDWKSKVTGTFHFDGEGELIGII